MNDQSIPSKEQHNDPLHGVKLAEILEHLVAEYGWEKLGMKIKIRCFTSDPSIKSSLTFLRKTPWAREKVEQLYLQSIRNKSGKSTYRKK
ncbi:VF530 family DNA-binding protein [Bacteroidota bacterium]